MTSPTNCQPLPGRFDGLVSQNHSTICISRQEQTIVMGNSRWNISLVIVCWQKIEGDQNQNKIHVQPMQQTWYHFIVFVARCIYKQHIQKGNNLSSRYKRLRDTNGFGFDNKQTKKSASLLSNQFQPPESPSNVPKGYHRLQRERKNLDSFINNQTVARNLCLDENKQDKQDHKRQKTQTLSLPYM